MTNKSKQLLIAAALTLFASAAAHAQSDIAVVAMPAPATTANDLHARAVSLYTQPHRYREAAALLMQASSLRASHDATSVRDLLDAGRLFANAQDNRAARAAFESAAERALVFGLLVTAANAYLDAAFVAIRQQDGDAVRTLTASAERLANSTHIDAAQRREIMLRINPARAAKQR
jgi:hypothetical protein